MSYGKEMVLLTMENRTYKKKKEHTTKYKKMMISWRPKSRVTEIQLVFLI